jgi:hypothetical protein
MCRVLQDAVKMDINYLQRNSIISVLLFATWHALMLRVIRNFNVIFTEGTAHPLNLSSNIMCVKINN